MKRFTSLTAIMVAVLLAFAPAGQAATMQSGVINISAGVAASTSFTAEIHQNSSTGPVVSAMSFGNLAATPSGNLTSPGSFVVMLSANTQQAPYVISQTGTALTSGANTIPTGACRVTPVYATADNGGAAIPSGAALGSEGTWVATNKTLYDSENSNAAIRTVQAHYAITESAGGVVPPSQPAGTYAGTVQFTVTY